MTTKYMKTHGDKIPKAAPKKRVKVRTRIEHVANPGQVPLLKQAEILHKALGWMDTPKFRQLAAEVIRGMREAGYRIAKLRPKTTQAQRTHEAAETIIKVAQQ